MRAVYGGRLKGVAVNLSKVKPGVVLVALLATAALIAGCGGSSNSSSSTAKTTTIKAVIKKVQTTAATTPASSSTPTTSNSSLSAFASSGNCQALAAVGTKFSQAIEAATSGGKLNYQAASKAYQQLADGAPSAIKPALEDLSSAFTAFVNKLAKVNYKPGKVPSASQLAGLESAAKSFSSTKMAKDEKDLEAWATKNCS
jgi:hypothetical protein